MDRASSQPWEIDIDVGPAAIPAEHLTKRVRNNINLPIKERLEKDDLITRGIVPLERATELFNIYHDKYDHFLYRILEKIDLSTVFDQRVRCYFQQYVLSVLSKQLLTISRSATKHS
jgi:hypothetical protein